MPTEVDLLHLLIGDLDARGVILLAQASADAQAC